MDKTVVKFQIENIEINQIKVSPQPLIFSQENYEFQLNVEHLFNVEEETVMVITSGSVHSDKKEHLAEVMINVFYRVDNLKNFENKKEKKMEFFRKHKKLLTILFSIVVFTSYFIITDPDARILQEMSFGVQIVLILGVFALAMPIIAFMEIHTDIYTDDLVGNEKAVKSKAMEESGGAGLILLSKAITLLSYAIILAAIIISVKDII